MASFLDDEEYYNKSFEEFRKKTNEVARDKEILSSYLPNVVSKILQGHQRSQFNVLSIGCGDGEMDRYIVKFIKEELQKHEKHKNTDIFTCAIDPSGHAVSKYKTHIDKSPNDDQIAYSVLKKSFEEYKLEQLSKIKSNEEVKFDIVFFIHSIYYVDPEEALVFCFEEELQMNGQVVCVVEGRDLMSLVLANIKPTLQSGKPAPDESYAEKFQKIAEKRGWKVDLHMQEYSIDVTAIFDEKSKEGNLLLDFLTQVKNFRTETEEKKVDEILQLIKESSEVMENGRRLGKKIDGVMIISKY